MFNSYKHLILIVLETKKIVLPQQRGRRKRKKKGVKYYLSDNVNSD
jgi:hypothetical protein